MTDRKKVHIWTACCALVLILFTVYVMLDTFVITRKIAVVDDGNPKTVLNLYKNTVSNTENSVSSAVKTINTYSDGNVLVTLSTYRFYDTDVYVADIKLTSADYIKTAFAQNTYGKNVTDETSSIAKAHNAIVAVNGDYYGSRNSGYVVRNGKIYRSEASNNDCLCIMSDGSFNIVNEKSTSAEELVSKGAAQILSFGPALIADSKITVNQSDEVGKSMASNPRTAIAMVSPLNYLMVVSDGRTDESNGLSLYELAEVLKSFGATQAYNLDGGGSSTMYFNGEVINNPTTNGNTIKERAVSDIVYIG